MKAKLVLLAMAALVLAIFLTGCGSKSKEPWDGTWVSDGMTATIEGDVIEVHFDTNGVRSLYWKGSFDPKSETVADEEIISIKKPETDLSLLGSQDYDKKFTAEDSNISFPMQIMGTRQTIVLVKQ